jgi:hypothetical protein
MKIRSLAFFAAVGFLVWMAIAAVTVRDLRSFAWSSALLSFAALVLVPLLLGIATEDAEPPLAGRCFRGAARLQFPAALLLAIAGGLPPGPLTGLLVFPWLVMTALLAATGAVRLLQRGISPAWKLCRDVGLVFVVIGGAWTLADRANVKPLGFGADIVQLTAVHFHYAGLALPLLAGCVLRQRDSRIGNAAGFGVLLGVPLVAIGITGAQFGAGTIGEFVAAAVLAPSAMVIGALQIRLAFDACPPGFRRGLLVGSAASLIVGMTLALLYAARGVVAVEWLDIPWMRASHGTLNALGFAFCGACAWFGRQPDGRVRESQR